MKNKKVDETFTSKDLVQLRYRLRMNQTEFGAQLGYRQPQIRIAELETGRKPIPKRIRMICEEIKRRLATPKSKLRSEGLTYQWQGFDSRSPAPTP